MLRRQIGELDGGYPQGASIPSRPGLRYVRLGKRQSGHGHIAFIMLTTKQSTSCTSSTRPRTGRRSLPKSAAERPRVNLILTHSRRDSPTPNRFSTVQSTPETRQSCIERKSDGSRGIHRCQYRQRLLLRESGCHHVGCSQTGCEISRNRREHNTPTQAHHFLLARRLHSRDRNPCRATRECHGLKRRRAQ